MPNVNKIFEEVTPDQYNDCIKYFLDTEVNGIIHNLSAEEKDQFFKMITDHSPILDTLFFLKGAPFTNFVRYGNEFYEALADHHEGIDYTPSWIVAEYKEWLTANNRPFPEDLAVKQGLDFAPLIKFQQENGIIPTTN